MMIIDGKKIAAEIQADIKEKIQTIRGRAPALAVILVGDDPASEIYVSRKAEACVAVGIRSIKRVFPTQTTQEQLLEEIFKLNKDPNVDGILVQLPLPQHINTISIIEAINPDKDVDGFHPFNMGQVFLGLDQGFAPCTPLGVMQLFEKCSIDLTNKHVVIIGRSNIVGKPMAAMLMQNTPSKTASVTVLHRDSPNIQDFSLLADIIIIAVGIPHFLTQNMVKKGAIVIDIGINRVPDPSKAKNYHIVGDADFENLKDHCSLITPVPGGVGPLTIAVLLENTLKSYFNHEK